ncbi:MAG: ATP-binding protein [Fimbriimonadaceae bacterium]|nr:ATP-binding protein [Fimbriimonadaceae bacterium]
MSFSLRLALFTATIIAVATGVLLTGLLLAQSEQLRRIVDDDLTRIQRPPGMPGRMPFGPPGIMALLRSPRGGPGDRNGPNHRGGHDDGHGGPPPVDFQLDLDRLIRESRETPIEFFALPKPVGHPDFPIQPISEAGAKRAIATGRDLRTVQVQGRTVRVYSTREVVGRDRDALPVVIQMARDITDLETAQSVTRTMVLWSVPAIVLIAGFGAFLMVRRGLGPLREMAEAAARISGERPDQRLPVRGNDELATVGTEFNGLLDRLNASFERQRRFTADASHELRTPLTRIRLLAGGPLDPTAAHQIDRTAADMAQMLEQLLVLARADDAETFLRFERLDLRDVIFRALEQLPTDAYDRIVTSLPDTPVVAHADAAMLARAVCNLLDNALRHTPPDRAPITLKLEAGAETARITVRDEGEGIAERDLPHIFDRLYRADQVRTHGTADVPRNMGLGLSIVRAVVDGHGGRVSVSSEIGAGSTFVIELPIPHEKLISPP